MAVQTAATMQKTMLTKWYMKTYEQYCQDATRGLSNHCMDITVGENFEFLKSKCTDSL